MLPQRRRTQTSEGTERNQKGKATDGRLVVDQIVSVRFLFGLLSFFNGPIDAQRQYRVASRQGRPGPVFAKQDIWI
jgi:hypothetical protein